MNSSSHPYFGPLFYESKGCSVNLMLKGFPPLDPPAIVQWAIVIKVFFVAA